MTLFVIPAPYLSAEQHPVFYCENQNKFYKIVMRHRRMTKEDIKKVLIANRETLKKYKVKSIALFGSYVRNEQKEDSDIDFLVDFDEGATLFDFVELQDNLS